MRWAIAAWASAIKMSRNSGVLFAFKNLAARVFGRFELRRSVVRLALLFAPWLLVLAAPALRPLMLQNDFANVSELWHGDYNAYEEHELPAPVPKNASLETQFSWHLERSESSGKYTALSKKFPRAAWLLAFRMKISRAVLLDNRIAAPLESRALNTGVFASKARARRRKSMKSVPAEDLAPGYALPFSGTYFRPRPEAMRVMLAVAQKGRVLEPQNSFWDWQCARLLFALRRDDEALKNLREGANKKFHDSHLREEFHARVWGQNPHDAFSPYSFLQSLDAPQTDLSWMSHVVNIAMSQAVAAERAGNHAQALQIADNIVRMSAQMRDGGYLKSESLAACGFAAMAWASDSRKVTLADMQSADPAMRGGTWLRVGARKFADYAYSHGEREIAARALGEAEKFAQIREQLELSTRAQAVDWPTKWPTNVDVKNVFFYALVMSLAAIMVQWWAMAAFRFVTFFMLIPGGLQAPPIRARDVARSLTFCFIATFCLCAVGLQVRTLWNLSTSFSNAAMPVAREDVGYVLLCFAFIAPVILSALWCAGVAVLRQEKEREPNEKWRARTRERLQALTKNLLDFRAASLAIAIISWSLIVCAAAGALGLFMLAITGNINASFPSSTPYIGGESYATFAFLPFIICTPLALGGWLIKWRWFAAPQWKSSAHGALETFRQSLSWWMVLLGWLFLLLALVTVSTRSSLETRLMRNIERGEVQSLIQRTR